MGTLVRRKKIWRYSARKVLEFDQQMTVILVNVSCKFEMYIFKIAQVINENFRIAFLYVLSICASVELKKILGSRVISIKPVLASPSSASG